MRVFMVGATGLIGVPLVQRLRERGDVPVVLTRSREKAAARWSGVEIVEGDPLEQGPWMAAIDGCQAVVNLVGESVFGKRWSEEQKRLLRDSRVVCTQNVVRAIEGGLVAPRRAGECLGNRLLRQRAGRRADREERPRQRLPGAAVHRMGGRGAGSPSSERPRGARACGRGAGQGRRRTGPDARARSSWGWADRSATAGNG